MFVGRIELRVELTGLPVTTSDELVVDAKPGLGALDIAAPGGPITVGVTVVHTVDGSETRRRFNVDIDGAARLTTAPSQSDGVVAVSRIERIRGPILGTVIVDANP